MLKALFTGRKLFWGSFFCVIFLFPLLYTVVKSYLPVSSIRVLEQTPWFRQPYLKDIPDGILPDGKEFKVLEHKRIACLPENFNNGQHFPVDFVLDMYKVHLLSGDAVWVSPDLVFNHGKTQIYTFGQNKYLPLLFSSLFGILFTLFCFKGILKKIFSSPCMEWSFFLQMLLLLIFLKQFLLSVYLYASECMQAKLIDEKFYMQIGYELFHVVTEKWKYPIGFPLLIAPVMAITGNSPEGIQNASEWISVFNGFILFPLVYAMLGGILYYFSVSCRRTFLVLLGLILLPFFVFPCEDFLRNIYTQWIDIPLLSVSYKSYYTMMWTSFNTLSDPSSTFFVILCIFYALFKSRGLMHMLIISMLFGFTCMIRINNIFYAPLLAYLFLMANKDIYIQNKCMLLRDVFCCFITFLISFLPQFYINYRDFSSIWTFSYILHDSAHQGFEFHVFFNAGMKYYTGCNQLLLAFACASLLMMKKGLCRTCFILWIIPLILFFSGYVCFSANPIRFILPNLLAAGCAVGCCKKVFAGEWSKREWQCFFLIFPAAILSFNPYCHEFIARFLPEESFWSSWQFIKCVILFAAALPVAFLCFRHRQITLFYFLLVFLFLMFPGSLLWAVLFPLLIMGIWEFIQEFCGIFLQKKLPELKSSGNSE